ncbi:hypothetical protein [Fluviicola taffensis]|uniref:Uncharacterized protein n=1 Tax=Fluviicola taffensis (strain DSM 16823 / NCIMB 13979 / RW262) TaxID=755732 RepID=F2II93_FLUTR|nr:hypothetical protein [Fluviicola taffensis]AEA43802.1 hypothetical protein Fluta_1814 [Fluviicola taffensis DSM 16823]
MRRTILLFVIIAQLPVFVVAQMKHDIGLSSSWRQFNYLEKQINLTGEYTIHLHKFNAGVGLGAECWYINRSTLTNPSVAMKPSFTGKLEPWIGFETKLFHSSVFVSANVGTRFYFLNQLRDSLILSEKSDNHFIINGGSKQHVLNTPNFIPGTNYPIKGKYYYVTKMPIAFLTRVNVGYAFKRFKISAFVMPYWVRFHYENAGFSERKGKTFLFFYDIGLGVNYTLPFKKKEKKTGEKAE